MNPHSIVTHQPPPAKAGWILRFQHERTANMKHEPTVICGTHLLGALCDSLTDRLPDGEEIDVQGWYVVRWPEHVTNPRYNGDADYTGPLTREEAIKNAGPTASVYVSK